MKCRACEHRTAEVMSFGCVALAGAFLKAEEFADEKKYPLTLQFCEKCLLVQTGEQVPAAAMFENYFYFSSATETMRKHFTRMASELAVRFNPKRLLEIGCNDGVLLRPLRALGVNAMGIDPAADMNADGRNIVRGYWPQDAVGGTFDVIVANNVFAHIADINAACSAIARSLTPDGTFIFEVNRLDELITGLQYDWVYHEHSYYYSLLALDYLLARHGLAVYDLSRIATHAGSIRYFVGHAGRHAITRKVTDQRDHELWVGLHLLGTFKRFAERAVEHRSRMIELVGRGKRIAGYGACGRTNTMLQFCGFDAANIALILDDAPAKQGYFTPGTHIPIVDRAVFDAFKPEMLIVFAWSFLAEIQPKLHNYRGRVVIPLPDIWEQSQCLVA